jgi:uncharacterized SAM-binding protein YcdF (DUF218 family)
MERFFDCITDFIFLENEPRRADVIFVPGGDYPESARKAAALFAQGYAHYVLPSGRFSKLRGFFPDPEGKGRVTEWEYLRDILMEEGVPERAILKEDQATFTWENAICSRRVLEELHIEVKCAILVCQAFHARRCRMYYQEQFPETRLMICPVETRGITRENWFLDAEKIDVVLGELERCGTQFHEIMKARL